MQDYIIVVCAILASSKRSQSFACWQEMIGVLLERILDAFCTHSGFNSSSLLVDEGNPSCNHRHSHFIQNCILSE